MSHFKLKFWWEAGSGGGVTSHTHAGSQELLMSTATKIYAERASVSTPIAAFLVLQGMDFALFCIDQDILSETPGRKKIKKGNRPWKNM